MDSNDGEAVDTTQKLKRIDHFNSVSEYANIPWRVAIDGLPSELIVNIARHISNIVNNVEISVGYFTGEDLPRYNSRSLLQLALCSRYLHRVVEPVLYERFHYSPKTSAKGFQLFLTRILARPDLGKWVRVFHVDDTEAPNLGMLSGGLLDYEEYYHYYYKTRFDVRQFTPEEMKATQKKIAETGMTDAECHWWALGVERMDLNAMIALVLTLTPNLEVLDIDMWTRPVGPQQLTPMLDLIGRLQRERELGHPLALWGLKRVVVRYCYDENMADIHGTTVAGYGPDIILDIVSLLMIPTVESLCASNQIAVLNDGYLVVNTEVDCERLEAASQGNNLELADMKDLSLSFITMRPNILFSLLGCCPNLKRLYYEDLLEYPDEPSVPAEFKHANMMSKICRLNPHLQDLTILHKGYVWSSMINSSFGSLNPFKSLRRLETNWATFTGWDDGNEATRVVSLSQSIVNAIPQSLELLRILGKPYDGIPFIENDGHNDIPLTVIFMLLEQKYRFPSLKILDFGWKLCRLPGGRISDDIHHGFTKEECLEVLALCQQVGVELILKP